MIFSSSQLFIQLLQMFYDCILSCVNSGADMSILWGTIGDHRKVSTDLHVSTVSPGYSGADLSNLWVL